MTLQSGADGLRSRYLRRDRAVFFRVNYGTLSTACGFRSRVLQVENLA